MFGGFCEELDVRNAQEEKVSTRSCSASLLCTWPTPTAGWQSSALPAYCSSIPSSEDARGLTKLHAPWFLCSSWLQTHFLAFLNLAASCCSRSIGNGQRLSSLTTATFAILFSSMCLARV